MSKINSIWLDICTCFEFCKNNQNRVKGQREQTMSTMLTQHVSADLGYGLNTLGPLCLWQCLMNYLCNRFVNLLYFFILPCYGLRPWPKSEQNWILLGFSLLISLMMLLWFHCNALMESRSGNHMNSQRAAPLKDLLNQWRKDRLPWTGGFPDRARLRGETQPWDFPDVGRRV